MRSFCLITLATSLFAGSALGCSGGLTDTDVGNVVDGGGPILDGGGGIALPPDGEKLCPQGVCNYQSNAGCSGATPSCVPSLAAGDTVAPSCQAAGPGMSGSTCSAWTDCAPGYIC